MVELWRGRRLRPGMGRRLRPCRAKFCPQVPVVFRLTSGITQVSGHFGGGGGSAWNHPGGRSLRYSRNTSVPRKISGEHPPHVCVFAHTEAGKSPGVSAPGITQWAGVSALGMWNKISAQNFRLSSVRRLWLDPWLNCGGAEDSARGWAGDSALAEQSSAHKFRWCSASLLESPR